MQSSANTRSGWRTVGLVVAFVAVALAGYLVGGGVLAFPEGVTDGAFARRPVVQAPHGGLWLFGGMLLLLSIGALVYRNQRSADPAMRDPVSGLYNDAYLDETLPGLMARDDRAGSSQLCLVRVDIAFLDDLQARHGRRAVDQVRAFVGGQVRSQVRESDIAAFSQRHGFVVFLHCGEPEQAAAFCRRMSMLSAGEQVEIGGEVVKVALRMGLAQRRVNEALHDLYPRAQHGYAEPRQQQVA